MKKHILEICSDFGQIIINDEEYDGEEYLKWNDYDLKNLACICKGSCGVGVIENDDHSLPIYVFDTKQDPELDKWHHIVEIPFFTQSGNLEIADEPFSIPAGDYIFRWNVKKTSDLSGEYELHIWQGKQESIKVLKQLE